MYISPRNLYLVPVNVIHFVAIGVVNWCRKRLGKRPIQDQ
jgi:hypothetical protein